MAVKALGAWEKLQAERDEARLEIGRIRSLLADSCVLIEELTEDTPNRAHAVRGRAIRREGGIK